MLNRFFKLNQHDTTVRKEIVAGITTFLTMAYILFVNPSILADAGMDRGALVTATALASCFGTLLMGLWVNVPLAMAPGMGLNAFFAYSLVIGEGIEWQTALGVVFVSGVIFVVLTLGGFREKIVEAIPHSLRLAIAAGIGLFITFIGFQNMGLITEDETTLITLGAMDAPVLLGLAGLVLILMLEARKIPGAILIGIAGTFLLAWTTGQAGMPDSLISLPPSPAPVAFELDIAGALRWGLMGAIFSFMFVDLLDSVGTLIACSYEANMVDEDGNIRKIGRMLEADAFATVAGALLGTSTNTTYIESASGIEEGGRTGLTAVVVGVLFLLALIFTPVIAAVPTYATAPALIVVGIMMFRNVRNVSFQRFEELVPAFITIILMPLTYSISTGLSFGFLAYILMMIVTGKPREIHWLMWGIGVFSAINLVITTI